MTAHDSGTGTAALPEDSRMHRAIADAIDRIIADPEHRPDLTQLADAAGLSPWHFQRTFAARVGVTPKQFGQLAVLGEARRLLAEGRASLLDTALELGLSGPSRLHDLFVTTEAMTPGAYRSGAAGLEIRWGLHDSPFGRALVALTDRGLCWLGFRTEAGDDALVAEFLGENVS